MISKGTDEELQILGSCNVQDSPTGDTKERRCRTIEGGLGYLKGLAA
jgi:hypothetical protein